MSETLACAVVFAVVGGVLAHGLGLLMHWRGPTALLAFIRTQG